MSSRPTPRTETTAPLTLQQNWDFSSFRVLLLKLIPTIRAGQFNSVISFLNLFIHLTSSLHATLFIVSQCFSVPQVNAFNSSLWYSQTSTPYRLRQVALRRHCCPTIAIPVHLTILYLPPSALARACLICAILG